VNGSLFPASVASAISRSSMRRPWGSMSWPWTYRKRSCHWRGASALSSPSTQAPDAAAQVIRETGGGAHGVLVTAVSPPAFAQALHLVRRKGTISLVGLPPGDFATPIFDVVLKRITLRGSIVGSREDLAEAIDFAAEGKVKAHIHRRRLEEINEVFADLKDGKVDGRIVLELG
jgi:alcohol dehydrogenase, propanol-preferring